jgi:hypothetical protein
MYQTIGGSTESRHIADKVRWHGVQAGVILPDFFMKQVSNIMCCSSSTIFFNQMTKSKKGICISCRAVLKPKQPIIL